jgi:hypothetical protein
MPASPGKKKRKSKGMNNKNAHHFPVLRAELKNMQQPKAAKKMIGRAKSQPPMKPARKEPRRPMAISIKNRRQENGGIFTRDWNMANVPGQRLP